MKKERRLTFDRDLTRDIVSKFWKDLEKGRLSLAPALYWTSRPKCECLEKRQQYGESVRRLDAVSVDVLDAATCPVLLFW